MNLAPNVCQRLLAQHGLLGSPNAKEGARDELLKLLGEHDLSWNDWPEFFAATTPIGAANPLPQSKICSRVCKLHALIGSPARDGWSARNKLRKLLAKHSLTWSHYLPAILAAAWANNTPVSPNAAASVDPEVNVFDLTRAVIEDRVVMTPAECTVSTLWTLNTHKYTDFAYAPQLGIVSPASVCGKSTALKTLKRLAAQPWYSHNATPPAIYRHLRRRPRTAVLLDEAENQNLLHDRKLRAIIDAAHECDGSVDLVEDGESVKFPVFAPIAYAIRGEIRDLPLSVGSRSFFIQMKRGTPKKRFIENDPDLLVAHEEISRWAVTCALDQNPEIPPVLCRDPRLADNCRPLLAIADALGRGAEARAALIELCAGRPNQDLGVQALIDIRTVWMALAVDRISVKALAEALVGLENGFWDDWRGPNDQGQPHKLTSGELSRLLRPFKIYAKTTWPVPRLPTSKSVRGYYRQDFETAWRDWCSDDTTTQPNKIIALAKS
jgi:hypothetical protein